MTVSSMLQSHLVASGWLPGAASFSHADFALGDDLLPGVLRAWDGVWQSGLLQRVGRDAEQLAWIRRQYAAGAQLTYGLPGETCEASRCWLGDRLAWWPHGIPSGRRVGVVSSRLGKNLDAKRAWFTIFRAACARTDAESEILMTAASTTTARFVERAAELFSLRVLRMNVDERGDLTNWCSRIRRSAPLNGDTMVKQVFLSPPLVEPVFDKDSAIGETPNRDRAVVGVCDKLLVFHVRRGGHLYRLIHSRLANRAWKPGTVQIAIGQPFLTKDISEELLAARGVGWIVLGAEFSGPDPRSTKPFRQPPTSHRLQEIIPVPPAGQWHYLTHCTRRQDGPWPHQSERQYLDQLLLNRKESDHSALATLMRMVREKRLIASSKTIRGGSRVVSFTAVPLARLPQLRKYRSHRRRWDFEPCGLCIKKEWLEELGARPVRYGDDELWIELAPEERPYFQLRGFRQRDGRQIVDQEWVAEQEWRHLGDVDLSDLVAEAGLLFVPTQSEAQRLATVSRWPITVIARGIVE